MDSSCDLFVCTEGSKEWTRHDSSRHGEARYSAVLTHQTPCFFADFEL